MAENKQPPPKVDPAREAELKKIEATFKKYEKEPKGSVEPKNLENLLKDDGFSTFNPTLHKNILNTLDFFNEGKISFDSYVWLHDLLTAAKKAFGLDSKGGKEVPISELENILKAINYHFPAVTLALIKGFLDKEKKQKFSFEQFITTLVFFGFAHGHFVQADTRAEGSLDFPEIKTLLPWLGIEHGTDDQVKAIFAKYDLDKNGKIDFEEFVGLSLSLKFPELLH